jgi:hypothetical protein
MHALFTAQAADKWRAAHTQKLTRAAQLARLRTWAARAETFTLLGMSAALILAALSR